MKHEIPSLEDCVKQIREENCNTLYVLRLGLLMPPSLGVNHICNSVQEAKDFISEMERQEYTGPKAYVDSNGFVIIDTA